MAVIVIRIDTLGSPSDQAKIDLKDAIRQLAKSIDYLHPNVRVTIEHEMLVIHG